MDNNGSLIYHDPELEYTDDGNRLTGGDSYGVIELPAFSWRKIPFAGLRKAETAGDIEAFSGLKQSWVEPFSAANRILSDISIEDGRIEIEKCNDSLSCWKRDWPSLHRTYSRLIACRVERGANDATLNMQWEAPGVDSLEQRFPLFIYRSDIEIKVSYMKLDITTPEGTYFAIPLNMGEWRCVYDTAGHYTELDEQQLPGVCRRARQPGFHSFTYQLSTFGAYDPEAAANAFTQAVSQIYATPVIECKQEEEGRFIRLEGEGVQVFDVKPAEEGEGIIVRLSNMTEDETAGSLSFPGKVIASAFETVGRPFIGNTGVGSRFIGVQVGCQAVEARSGYFRKVR